MEKIKSFFNKIVQLCKKAWEFIKAKKESLGCMYSPDMSAEDKKKCLSAPQDMIKKWKKESEAE